MTDHIQIALMAILVGTTIFYAYQAKKANDSAKASAQASVKMAEEMKEQRLSEAQPYLLLRLAHEVFQWDKTEQGEQPAREFPITIRNVGKGPAINLWAALWDRRNSYFSESKGYLAPDEEWETTVSRASTSAVELGIEKDSWLPELRQVIEREYPGVVTVKYNDIHQRVWVTYLCLERHVDVEYFVMEEEQKIVELNKNDKRSH